jgi:hypothetical protein
MNLYYNFIAIIVAIISALPVIIINQFVVKNIFTRLQIFTISVELFFIYAVIIYSYFYFIFKKISLSQFFPMIKMIELVIPVIVGIILYKDKLNYINYFGLLLAIISIICIQWNN